MKKRILSAMLAVSMLTGIGIVAQASDEVDPAAPELAPYEVPEDVKNNLTTELPNDVKDEKTAWYYKEVKTVYDIGYLTGKGGADAGNWKPFDSTTRAEMARILRRVAGVSDDDIKGKGGNVTFNDTKDHWAANDIAWAAEMGIVNGYNDGEYFAPNKEITRAEIAAMFTRAAANENLDIDLSGNTARVDGFADTADHWAAKEIEAARVGGLINGKATDAAGKALFIPNANANRAEVATMLTRFDMDPMHYAISNLREYVPTESTRPMLQFGNKAEMTLDAINKILLPQLGLDSETYTMVVPDYQLADYTEEEEHRYQEKKKIKYELLVVDEESGDYVYVLTTCGCGSAKCTNGFGGLGGGGSLDDSRCIINYYFAIKNKVTGEMTKYTKFECKVVKLPTAVDADAAYVGLQDISKVTAYVKGIDEAIFTQVICLAAEANECLCAEDMPEGYAYSATIPDTEMQALKDAYSALAKKDDETAPITIHVTLKNRASGADPVQKELQMVLVKDSFPVPYVEAE